jgi:hypothetical protein
MISISMTSAAPQGLVHLGNFSLRPSHLARLTEGICRKGIKFFFLT